MPVSSRSCVEPGCQQGGIAAELVDHKSGDESLVVGLENRDRPVQVGQQPAAVDVADKDDGQVRGTGQPHIRQIGCTQVDLGWRSRTFTDHSIEFASQRLQFVGHNGRKPVPVVM